MALVLGTTFYYGKDKPYGGDMDKVIPIFI
jgi:hypothetical protein